MRLGLENLMRLEQGQGLASHFFSAWFQASDQGLKWDIAIGVAEQGIGSFFQDT